MSILLGIAVLFGVMFAMFSGYAGGEMSSQSRTRLTLRSRVDRSQPQPKMELLLEGVGFEPDSQVRFVAWHLPDGHGSHHHVPVEGTPRKLRGSYFEDLPFAPAITLAAFTGADAPHDIKIIATDDHGNAAEAWISGKDFYLPKASGVAV